MFAVKYLLANAVVSERLNENTFFSVAKKLAVPPELLDFKFNILKRKSWQIESPVMIPAISSNKYRIGGNLMNLLAKIHVSMMDSFFEDGQLLPRKIRWEDGQQGTIDKKLGIRRHQP